MNKNVRPKSTMSFTTNLIAGFNQPILHHHATKLPPHWALHHQTTPDPSQQRALPNTTRARRSTSFEGRKFVLAILQVT